MGYPNVDICFWACHTLYLNKVRRQKHEPHNVDITTVGKRAPKGIHSCSSWRHCSWQNGLKLINRGVSGIWASIRFMACFMAVESTMYEAIVKMSWDRFSTAFRSFLYCKTVNAQFRNGNVWTLFGVHSFPLRNREDPKVHRWTLKTPKNSPEGTPLVGRSTISCVLICIALKNGFVWVVVECWVCLWPCRIRHVCCLCTRVGGIAFPIPVFFLLRYSSF